VEHYKHLFAKYWKILQKSGGVPSFGVWIMRNVSSETPYGHRLEMGVPSRLFLLSPDIAKIYQKNRVHPAIVSFYIIS
jgi:hypothetical protein